MVPTNDVPHGGAPPVQSQAAYTPAGAIRVLSRPDESELERLIKEWLANIDLQKFHELLKQQRLTHFLTVQTAFVAFVGLLATAAVRDNKPELLLAGGILSFLPYALAEAFNSVDQRARAYIDVVKGRLLLLEEAIRGYGTEAFKTYTEQFDILVRANRSVLDNYVRVRNTPQTPDPLSALAHAPPAHRGETSAVVAFSWFWIVAGGSLVVVGTVWLRLHLVR